MESLIFGSTALKHWCPDLPRTPKDIDIIAKKPIEGLKVDRHYNPAFDYILEHNKHPVYVDLDFLYTIKVSHAAWNIWWDKTMHDIKFMQDRGCKLVKPLYDLLIKDWETIHHKKKIKVEGDPKEFFRSNIDRALPHEEVHELVKFGLRPLHESIRENKDNVKVSKLLWDKLTFEDQIKCALEEAYVFALERYSYAPPRIALRKALKHLITKTTKGFFNLFLIENYNELVYYDRIVFDKHYENYKELING